MKRVRFVIQVVIYFTLANFYTNIQSFSQSFNNKFKQLDVELTSPNTYRTASGAPGVNYWQQQADYDINITLDETTKRIYGEETITYINNSPDELKYIWIQLDQNINAPNSDKHLSETFQVGTNLNLSELSKMHYNFDGGFKLDYVRDALSVDLKYFINKTMMRVDLPQPLAPKSKFQIKIKWWYNIQDRLKLDDRSGYEYFKKDDNYLFTIAQFYPRVAVYSDWRGWHTEQYLGEGEFTLNFGNFKVAITVPADHIVAATGVLQNKKEVLTEAQQAKLILAEKSDKPVIIVTQKEAETKEKTKASTTKTWIFNAENVRDFAFATSRKFIWDAMGVPVGNRIVMAMSFYPKEGNPLWEELSTKVVAHTIKSYAKYTFDYPYPVVQSVHTLDIGMEYPMISFNGGRPNANGTYWSFERENMISVIIHEVGHNFFPMIINSDERLWGWMDEGFNTFIQYLAEQEFEPGYNSWAGPADKIVFYMNGNKQKMTPIMTAPDMIRQLGNEVYYKPATALNILRETILGHELFDFSFKEYASRWMFKNPTPADFFRTMEDASGVDLDWFWRGWFYTTDNVDIALDNVKIYHVGEPEKQKKEKDSTQVITLSKKEFVEYYNDDFKDISGFDINKNYYAKIDLSNQGGLIMPIILQFDFEDGTNEVIRIPVEIWRKNYDKISKAFVFNKRVTNVVLDPFSETADVKTSNNYWPANQQKSGTPKVQVGTE